MAISGPLFQYVFQELASVAGRRFDDLLGCAFGDDLAATVAA